MKRALLITLGFLALGLGGIGIALPILPTTPFVLCAAGCFAASSPSLYGRLQRAKFFGEYIRSYREGTGISPKARGAGIAFLWATLGISAAAFRSPSLWIILAAVGICVSIHILTVGRKP